MIHTLVLLLTVVTDVASYYLMKKSATLLLPLKRETTTEGQQFTECFGRYYLVTVILGVLAAIFNRPLLPIGLIFFVLLLSTLFNLTFAKRVP